VKRHLPYLDSSSLLADTTLTMPQSVTLHLVPDPKEDGVLHGRDDGTIVAKAIKPNEVKLGEVDYEVSSHVAVHGKAKVNGKQELASLLVFKVQATSPRRRPIEEMVVTLSFKNPDPTKALSSAPKLFQISPDQRGYKVECSQGTLSYNKTQGGSLGLGAGADMAKAEGELHKDTEEGMDQPIEFYTNVYGSWRGSDRRVKDLRNLAYWSFEGRTPSKGSAPKGAVPPVTWIAILLTRPEEGAFTCEAKVHIKVDFAWTVENKKNNLLYDSPYGQITYDTSVSEHPDPDHPIPSDSLEEYLKQEKMKELVDIMMPIDYAKWKYDALPAK